MSRTPAWVSAGSREWRKKEGTSISLHLQTPGQAALGLGRGERRCDPRRGLIPCRPAPPPCLHSSALFPRAPRSTPLDHKADPATCRSRWVWIMPFCAHSRSGVYTPQPPPRLPLGTLSPLLPSPRGRGQTVGSTLTQARQDQSTRGPDPSPWPTRSLAGATTKALDSTPSTSVVLASPRGHESPLRSKTWTSLT